ncbi:hypothetical protein FOZ62_000235 [Perkinsus olseni]|uniref:Uncharacterized protein n=1 Tax=Perkinsus olseni TaxID=32597 RepID=A0A7J6RUI0_PEROL|nr:hypothetical protein FOZ62_000235 [Perkinsus olseni]
MAKLSDSEHVVLEFSELQDSDYEEVVANIRHNPLLKSITLRGVCLGPGRAMVLAQALRYTPLLKRLSLRHNPLVHRGDGSGLKAICEVLEAHTSIRQLDLRRTALDDSNAAAIKQLLMRNRSILALDIAENPLSEEGLCMVMDGICVNDKIIECRFPGRLADGSSIRIDDPRLMSATRRLQENRTALEGSLMSEILLPKPGDHGETYNSTISTRDDELLDRVRECLDRVALQRTEEFKSLCRTMAKSTAVRRGLDFHLSELRNERSRNADILAKMKAQLSALQQNRSKYDAEEEGGRADGQLERIRSQLTNALLAKATVERELHSKLSEKAECEVDIYEHKGLIAKVEKENAELQDRLAELKSDLTKAMRPMGRIK